MNVGVLPSCTSVAAKTVPKEKLHMKQYDKKTLKFTVNSADVSLTVALQKTDTLIDAFEAKIPGNNCVLLIT